MTSEHLYDRICIGVVMYEYCISFTFGFFFASVSFSILIYFYFIFCSGDQFFLFSEPYIIQGWV